MPTIDRLPGPEDGIEGLLALAGVFGARQVYDFIRLCRTRDGSGRGPGGEAQTELAQRMIAAEQDEANVDYETARRRVAVRLGYTTYGTQSNFYKIASGEGRQYRPRASSGTTR